MRPYVRYPERAAGIQRFIEQFIAEHGYSPSVREIGEAVGLPSPGSIGPLVKRMREEGLLTGNPNQSRTIRVGEAVMIPRTETM